MVAEAKKLHLIEEIIKIENDAVLEEMESVLAKNKQNTNTRRSFKEFAGMLTDEEVDQLEKTIEEGCETINPDAWK